MEGKNESKHTPEDGIIPFLLGSGTLGGQWFSDIIQPSFWWRKHLREYNAALLEENEKLKKEIERLAACRIWCGGYGCLSKNDNITLYKDDKSNCGKGSSEVSRLRAEVDRLTKEKNETVNSLELLHQAIGQDFIERQNVVTSTDIRLIYDRLDSILTRIK